MPRWLYTTPVCRFGCRCCRVFGSGTNLLDVTMAQYAGGRLRPVVEDGLVDCMPGAVKVAVIALVGQVPLPL